MPVKGEKILGVRMALEGPFLQAKALSLAHGRALPTSSFRQHLAVRLQCAAGLSSFWLLYKALYKSSQIPLTPAQYPFPFPAKLPPGALALQALSGPVRRRHC